MKVTQVAIRPTEASNSAGRPALTPELLADSGARYSPDNIPHAIVVGCPLWDFYGLESLSIFAERVRSNIIPIYAFDFDACLTMDDIWKFMPGMPTVFNTPIIGEYSEGKLARAEQGRNAHQWMRQFGKATKIE